MHSSHEEIVDKVLGHRQMKCKIAWEIQPYFLSLRQEESREVRVSNFVVPNLQFELAVKLLVADSIYNKIVTQSLTCWKRVV